MPNWCSNKLTVSAGDGAFDRKRFWASCRTGPGEDATTAERVVASLAGGDKNVFSFAALLPEPQYATDSEWYDWRVRNWGTKWDLSPEGGFIEQDDEEGAVVIFDTAWAPPNRWFEALATRHPEWEMSLVYAEQGDCFAGQLISRDGQVFDDAAPRGEEREFLTKLGLEDWWFEDEEEVAE